MQRDPLVTLLVRAALLVIVLTLVWLAVRWRRRGC
jgi:hypothetical protein